MISNIDAFMEKSYIKSFIPYLEANVEPKYHKYVLNTASKIEDLSILFRFLYLAIDKTVVKSKHYKFILNCASKISKLDVLEQFYDLVTHKTVLESEHCQYILKLASKYKSSELLKSFIEVVSTSELIKSQYYLDVINVARKITDASILHEFALLVHNEELFNSEYYIHIINKTTKIKDLSVHKFRKFSYVASLLCPSKCKQRNQSEQDIYFYCLDLVCSLPDDEFIDEFVDLLINIPKNFRYFNLVIENALKIKDKNLLHEFHMLVTTNKFLQLDYCEAMICFISENCSAQQLQSYRELVIVYIPNLISKLNLRQSINLINNIFLVTELLKEIYRKNYRLLDDKVYSILDIEDNEQVIKLLCAIASSLNLGDIIKANLSYDDSYARLGRVRLIQKYRKRWY